VLPLVLGREIIPHVAEERTDLVTTVYPKSLAGNTKREPIACAVLLGLGAAIAVGLAWGLAVPFFALGLAIAAGLVFWAARIVRDVVDQARNPLPLFRLDRVGLESALGQLQWRDVELVHVDRHEQDHGERWTISFVTDAGAALATSGDVYYGGRRYRRPRRTAAGIEVPLWESRPIALRDVRRFYDGRVSDEYETPITSFPVESRYRPCPDCGHLLLRDGRKCRACGQLSEPWSYRDGRWWYTSATGRRQWLDEDANAWRWEDDGTPSTPLRPPPGPRMPLSGDEQESAPRPRLSALDRSLAVATLVWLVVLSLVIALAIWPPPDSATLWAAFALPTCLLLLVAAVGRERSGKGHTWQLGLLSPLSLLGPFVLALFLLRAGVRRGFVQDLRCAVRGGAKPDDASRASIGVLPDPPHDPVLSTTTAD